MARDTSTARHSSFKKSKSLDSAMAMAPFTEQEQSRRAEKKEQRKYRKRIAALDAKMARVERELERNAQELAAVERRAEAEAAAQENKVEIDAPARVAMEASEVEVRPHDVEVRPAPAVVAPEERRFNVRMAPVQAARQELAVQPRADWYTWLANTFHQAQTVGGSILRQVQAVGGSLAIQVVAGAAGYLGINDPQLAQAREDLRRSIEVANARQLEINHMRYQTDELRRELAEENAAAFTARHDLAETMARLGRLERAQQEMEDQQAVLDRERAEAAEREAEGVRRVNTLQDAVAEFEMSNQEARCELALAEDEIQRLRTQLAMQTRTTAVLLSMKTSSHLMRHKVKISSRRGVLRKASQSAL